MTDFKVVFSKAITIIMSYPVCNRLLSLWWSLHRCLDLCVCMPQRNGNLAHCDQFVPLAGNMKIEPNSETRESYAHCYISALFALLNSFPVSRIYFNIKKVVGDLQTCHTIRSSSGVLLSVQTPSGFLRGMLGWVLHMRLNVLRSLIPSEFLARTWNV